MEPGVNAAATSNVTFPDTLNRVPLTVQVDVSKDLLAWAQGSPNYGWAFIMSGGDGQKIASFEDEEDPIPTLVLGSRLNTPINRTTAPNTNRGHSWKYWDQLAAGDNPYPRDVQGDTWGESDYDDSAWPSGPAVIGNGNLRGSTDTNDMAIDEAPEADELPFGTRIRSSASSATPRYTRETDLFRTTFDVASLTGVNGMAFDILAEDGAVIYVNGVEVARTNVADDPATTGSTATGRAGVQESTYQQLITIFERGSNPLVAGRNTVAVELHQDRDFG